MKRTDRRELRCSLCPKQQFLGHTQVLPHVEFEPTAISAVESGIPTPSTTRLIAIKIKYFTISI